MDSPERQRLIEATQRELNGTPLKRLSMVEAIEHDREIPWLLSGWLCRGDIGILAGDSGVGKSWLMMDLALCLAARTTWLDRVRWADSTTPPQRVLYVDEENSEALAAYRVQRWARGRGQSADAMDRLGLVYLVENSLNLDTRRAFNALSNLIESFRPDWVFLDSLIRFHSRNENDNAAMGAFFVRRIRSLRDRFGCGILGLHHLNKPSPQHQVPFGARLRGASDLRAQVDQLWGLEVQDGRRRLLHDKNRWAQTQAALAVDFEDCEGGSGIRITSGGDAHRARELIELDLMTAGHVGRLRSELVALLANNSIDSSERVASYNLTELHKEGKLSKRREGRSMRYWLASSAPLT